MRGFGLYTTVLVALSTGVNVLAFNAPSDVPTWCGKPYMST
jgi:hypothetical protein